MTETSKSRTTLALATLGVIGWLVWIAIAARHPAASPAATRAVIPGEPAPPVPVPADLAGVGRAGVRPPPPSGQPGGRGLPALGLPPWSQAVPSGVAPPVPTTTPPPITAADRELRAR